ncbi:hypothetical protein KU6B_44840 [Mameliella alba]|uniref:hypothetical protein n=1 Tax=Mameliella alba TaxID=561184 RepID=UPI0013E5139E|nr:hypothetical protein [Mameliella alba]BBU58219.1 hypothetical protein KU6B_44840 [Mameliella alba]
MSALLRALAALTCLTLAAPAWAGEWTRLDPAGFGDCNLRFDGVIEPGDLMRATQEDVLGGFNARICLNSPGGSLAEVLNFLKAANSDTGGFFFGTRVRTGDECLSSCAILFMFGQAFGANSPYPSRQLEPGARLGFHSPFIRDGANPAASDAEVFRVALQVAKLLADSSYKALTASGPALPPELLAIVLGTPSADMRYVDTIAEAKLMDIELTEDLEYSTVFPDTRASFDQIYRRICISTHTLTYRQHFVREGYDFADLVARTADPTYQGADYAIHVRERDPAQGSSPERRRALLTGPSYSVPGWFSAGAQQYCRVDLSVEPAPGGLRVISYSVDFGAAISADLTRTPEWRGEVQVTRGGLRPLDTRY